VSLRTLLKKEEFFTTIPYTKSAAGDVLENRFIEVNFPVYPQPLGRGISTMQNSDDPQRIRGTTCTIAYVMTAYAGVRGSMRYRFVINDPQATSCSLVTSTLVANELPNPGFYYAVETREGQHQLDQTVWSKIAPMRGNVDSEFVWNPHEMPCIEIPYSSEVLFEHSTNGRCGIADTQERRPIFRLIIHTTNANSKMQNCSVDVYVSTGEDFTLLGLEGGCRMHDLKHFNW